MGRLFWKIFLGFWLTLVFMGGGVGLLVYVHNQQRVAEFNDLAAGPWAARNVVSVATALQYGGLAALHDLTRQWPGLSPLPVLVVSDDGRDALGRPVPQRALARARAALADAAPQAGVRRVTTPGGHAYLLFVPVRLPFAHLHRHGPFGAYRFYLRLGVALLASLLFSAALAWYLVRPLGHLRRAAQRLANGDLGVRVMPLLGGRRDETAELARDFDHMAGRLQALIGAQNRLLSDVSHELRSPLARLQVAVALAWQQPDKLPLALKRIEREGERLDALVGQFLTLSRIEAGVDQGPAEYVDVGALLENVVEDARFEAAGHGKRVELSVGHQLMVHGRSALLLRAFENVIRNAIRYTADGTTVDVSAERATSEPWLSVMVCDHGPGVPADKLEVLFDPFVRGRDDEPDGLRGYGLGLAITRRAVEAHGGNVHARNRSEGGLCVEIRLPSASESALVS
ncbi:MAG: hypothetical protein B7Z66_13410 [Chromatiales bacterium 21-64-14]|nr:MAG: hypothetical protein B7Z66_13410 [Chromatiales bacterium 21-64-14]HQU16886.1 ATP-binding protein [Gammaproteobacteria bacterium]